MPQSSAHAQLDDSCNGYRVCCLLEKAPAWVCNEKHWPALTTVKVEGHATRDPQRTTLQRKKTVERNEQ